MLALLAACSEPDQAGKQPGSPDPGMAAAPDAGTAQARNLVLICIDTVRSDSLLGVMPASQSDAAPAADALTPWLESVVNYRNTQSTSPWTIPSVASVMTGLYPAQHGAGQFPTLVGDLSTQVPTPLGESAVTITELLAEAGYRIGGFSAHPWFSSEFGLDQGFGRIHRQKRWDQLVPAFERWLGNSSDPEQPFFGYIHLMDAHSTHNQPETSLSERIESATAEEMADALLRNQVPECQAPYNLRCKKNLVYNLQVAEVRKAIARVLGHLEETGVLDETLVVVYSDHGEAFWEHQQAVVALGGDPRRQQRDYGHGQTLYQTLLDVPLLVWHPAVSEGVQVNQLVSLVDVFPSLLEWLALEAPEQELPGRTLPLQAQVRQARHAWSSGIAYGPQQIAVRSQEPGDDRKAVWHAQSDQFNVFDLAADRSERQPLSDDQLLWTMEPLIGDYQELPGLAASAAPEVTNEQLERLKAIGYLQGMESDPNAASTGNRTEPDINELPEDTATESDEDQP